jgi:HPt (histidine-containing phosphotransfer) domain-containing protein
MDGYTATSHLRRNPRFKDLPIIAMTAHAMTGDEEKSMAAGMNDHVTKPIDPAQLLATLAKWIAPREPSPSEELHPAAAHEKTTTEPQPGSPAPPPGTHLDQERGTINQEPREEQPFPDALSGFDLAEGLQRLQGNKGLYRKLLLSFAAGYAQTADDLRKVLDANDYDQAHSLVHSIKGVAGNLAARELHVAAVGLEKLLKHADEKNPPPPESINEALTAFDAQLELALQAVRSLPLPEGGPSPAPPVEPVASLPPELAKEAAARLREAADMGDVSSLMAIADEFLSRSVEFAPYQAKITQLADDFDLDGILVLANDLVKEQGD